MLSISDCDYRYLHKEADKQAISRLPSGARAIQPEGDGRGVDDVCGELGGHLLSARLVEGLP